MNLSQLFADNFNLFLNKSEAFDRRYQPTDGWNKGKY